MISGAGSPGQHEASHHEVSPDHPQAVDGAEAGQRKDGPAHAEQGHLAEDLGLVGLGHHLEAGAGAAQGVGDDGPGV